MKADGTIDKYKDRLVIKGYRQKEGLDYFNTISLVSRIISIRMILSIVTLRNLEVHQMDVKINFLNGYLDEEIYMEQPEGHIVPGQERKVRKLVKPLYRLKQAPKKWHEKFDNRSSEVLILTQSHCVNKILGRFNKDDSGIARTSIDTSQHLSKNKGESVDQVEYASVMGSLMYLMSCTRPDIVFTDSMMPVGYLVFKIPKAKVDMFLH
ncbi:Retrovirus-related Pol polyprotein from transposon TNT 1-94 [Gossypium australe]|uniref:Retrovirus-related Pol polyprotein from transposon TNT 1-94 n=1 Tax=Gossypium australe TaxID=47621 RepID=A0A5B6WHQ7_9ROSI|nr:Retrovirus-related Pol polyprotein from transposon TNT 1-94 [Gossypium australe]